MSRSRAIAAGAVPGVNRRVVPSQAESRSQRELLAKITSRVQGAGEERPERSARISGLRSTQVALTVAFSSNPLLSPAIKGIAVGFAVGLAAILALMLFLPTLVHADTLPAAQPPELGHR